MTTVPFNPIAHELPAAVAADTEAARIQSNKRDHRFILRSSLLVVITAFLLIVRADGRVAFFFAPGWAVPESCPSHVLLHMDCPGCGLTRSIVSLAHGQWRQSLAFHPVGVALAIVFAAQIPYRIMCLKRGRCPGVPAIVERVTPWLLIVAMVGNHLWRLFGQ